jgi:hypothetical protein
MWKSPDNSHSEWLVDRKKLPKTWKKSLSEVRSKIIAAVVDLPQMPLLSSSNLARTGFPLFSPLGALAVLTACLNRRDVLRL